MSAEASSPTSLRVPASMVEGLFVRALPADPDFHAALRAVGVDVEKLLPHYPVEVWQEAMAVARQHFHAGQPRPQADWQLGRAFARGFLETLVGRVIAVTLPMLGPARLVERIPRHLTMGRADMRATVEPLGERERQVRIEARHPLPDFMAGCIELMMERTKVKPQVEVLERAQTSYTLRVRW
ncbi:DUF2378 family protein [Pyxidicoccus parkwayensis]|uniref:DUF2378 family protein n=1 Tax=Pyxidicoccus parkwayensis TaxID=2813578 RepID=A0ABX7P091_9BACT|nr:DUF2378 family protein [Pyxidicoccus parkwaysis]QSQ24596.1 DUF2378 family protein [Pyxidicoccus parkwaysis]